MEQQNALREQVYSLLTEIKNAPENHGHHNRLWYLLLSARISPERLDEIENCYKDVMKAYTLCQPTTVGQEVTNTLATKRAKLLDALSRYEVAIQRGVDLSGTASLRDMVILLAKKHQALHAYLKEKMRFVDSLLRTHGISYWAVAGTLIGAIRHQGIIPWDRDLDLEMTEADFQRFITLEDLLQKEAGLSIRKLKWRGHYKLANNFDIFVNDTRKPPSGSRENLFPYKDEIFPLREFQFYDFKIYGPNKAEHYLKREYGDDCFSTCRIWNYFVNSYFSRQFDPDKYVLTLQEVNQILRDINFDEKQLR